MISSLLLGRIEQLRATRSVLHTLLDNVLSRSITSTRTSLSPKLPTELWAHTGRFLPELDDLWALRNTCTPIRNILDSYPSLWGCIQFECSLHQERCACGFCPLGRTNLSAACFALQTSQLVPISLTLRLHPYSSPEGLNAVPHHTPTARFLSYLEKHAHRLTSVAIFTTLNIFSWSVGDFLFLRNLPNITEITVQLPVSPYSGGEVDEPGRALPAFFPSLRNIYLDGFSLQPWIGILSVLENLDLHESALKRVDRRLFGEVLNNSPAIRQCTFWDVAERFTYDLATRLAIPYVMVRCGHCDAMFDSPYIGGTKHGLQLAGGATLTLSYQADGRLRALHFQETSVSPWSFLSLTTLDTAEDMLFKLAVEGHLFPDLKRIRTFKQRLFKPRDHLLPTFPTETTCAARIQCLALERLVIVEAPHEPVGEERIAAVKASIAHGARGIEVGIERYGTKPALILSGCKIPSFLLEDS